MDKRKLVSAGLVALVVVLVLGYVGFRKLGGQAEPGGKLYENAEAAASATPAQATPDPDLVSASEIPSTFSGSPIFKILDKKLPSVKTPYTCASAAELKKNSEDSAKGPEGSRMNLFWEGAGSSKRFLYYEVSKRLLIACDGHDLVAVNINGDRDGNDVEGLRPDEERVDIMNPHFSDWDGEAGLEFVLFNGQCVEGPCIGGQEIYRMKDGQLTQIAEIDGDQVSVVVAPPAKTVVTVQPSCYDFDFGAAFDYVEVIKFGGPKTLTLVPFNQVAKAYPAALSEIRKVAAEPVEADQKRDAFKKIQSLVVKAYDGVAYASLMRDYNEIIKVFATPVDPSGEVVTGADAVTEGAYAAPVHCDPPAILEMIAGSQPK